MMLQGGRKYEHHIGARIRNAKPEWVTTLAIRRSHIGKQWNGYWQIGASIM
jgi:hypothetical protein